MCTVDHIKETNGYDKGIGKIDGKRETNGRIKEQKNKGKDIQVEEDQGYRERNKKSKEEETNRRIKEQKNKEKDIQVEENQRYRENKRE